MALIRPRLNDFHNLPFTQEEADFAIPFLDEDIPLYVDPFLLWRSPSMQDMSLHTAVLNSFNQLGHSYVKGRKADAITTLVNLTECDEVGLGNSKTRKGKRIGEQLGNEILGLYEKVPQIHAQGFRHFEEIQLLVDNIGPDRVSDIVCSIIKSFLIDYTIDQCRKWSIPIDRCTVDVYDYQANRIKSEEVYLPTNPENDAQIILVPKRWLRRNTWIGYDDYFSSYFVKAVDEANSKKGRVEILNFNRHNYDLIEAYISIKESHEKNCTNDPLFTQIPVLSAKRKLDTVLKLPTGKTDNADRQYEDNMVQLMSSMLYPHLDFAQEQSRIDSGTQIRDLIFYNNRSHPFLKDVYDQYDSRQVVIELKNVASVEREHVNQLNRYLTEQFGRFGILFTRNPTPKNILQNTIDLWSGQRRCILIFDDTDLKLMCDVYESKQRLPLEVLNRKLVQFSRACPS